MADCEYCDGDPEAEECVCDEQCGSGLCDGEDDVDDDWVAKTVVPGS